LRQFDLVAFSISFENDYLNLPAIFELGRIPWLAAERGEDFPLLLSGGVCAFLNPEPLAEVMDLFAIGEAEPILPGLIEALCVDASRTRDNLVSLASLSGIYVPSLYTVQYDADGQISGWQVEGDAPLPVKRVWQADLDASEARNFVQTEETEFGDMALTEISRGCSRGCRFCAAGFLFLPSRQRSLDSLLEQADEGLCSRSRIGLVSPAVGDYPQLNELQKGILERGGSVSVASLRIDSLTADEVDALVRSGHKTVALAPEAGSQRMRDSINKGVNEEQILHAVKLLSDGGVPNLKLYFLVGLPMEGEEDVREITSLTSRIREAWLPAGKRRGRLGSIHLSVNPFVPKPFTPLQWAPMATAAELKKKMKVVRSDIGRLANVSAGFESVRSALVQGLLSRGERELAAVVPMVATGMKMEAACRQAGVDSGSILHRQRSEAEILPWEVVASGVRRDYLWQEWQQSLSCKRVPRCFDACECCGVC